MMLKRGFIGTISQFLYWCLVVHFPAQAQIVPDGTTPSVVTSNDNSYTITGGSLDQSGHNLFHSFLEFSVPTNGEASFNNALAIQNIFTRVTGSSISQIDGIIKAKDTANLFLINPNGVIFGPNASINIGGSFIASSANSIKWANGQEFSAVNPQAPPLLIVNVPFGLQFGNNPAPIVNRSQFGDGEPPPGLQVKAGQTLALLGGNVALEKGNLTASGGRIELGSVGSNSFVSVNSTESSLTLGYSGVNNFQDIQVSGDSTEGSIISANTDTQVGNINLQGRRITIADSSQIFSFTLGSETGGGVTINASEALELTGANSVITTQVGIRGVSPVSGNGGTLTINTRQLILRDGAAIATASGINNSGLAGDLNINASELVELTGKNPSFLSTTTGGSGKGGNLTINTSQLIVRDGSQIQSATVGQARGQGGILTVNASKSVEVIGTGIFNGQTLASGLLASSGIRGLPFPATGNGGDININTPNLIVQDGAEVSVSSLGSGNAGNIEIQAPSILLNNQGKLTASTEAIGSGGNLTINTSQLTVRDSSEVSVSSLGSGNAGNIEIQAPSILLNNQGKLTASTEGIGSGGNLTINTSQLTVRDGSRIESTTLAQGNGGMINVNASNLIELSASGLLASSGDRESSLPATGNGGNININTPNLIIQDGAEVSVSSLGSGNAGNIEIQAPSILLNNQGKLTASTEGIGSGGNLTINTSQLTVRDGSRIESTTLAQGNGGMINVNASNLIELSASDLLASSGIRGLPFPATGNGGNIDINTPNLIIQDGAEVSVSSLGSGNAGNIEIQAPSILLNNQGKLTASTEGIGSGGNLTINTSQLTVRDGSQIESTTLAKGKGGIINVNASNSIELSASGLLASSGIKESPLPATGNGGDININTPNLIVQDSAEVSVSNFGSGNAGNIDIDAQFILLDNQAKITAETASGEGGNINLQVGDILMLRHNSLISTTAGTEGGGGNGGNININAMFIIAVPSENSDIIANAFTGNGGNINITAKAIFGIEPRERLTPLSDITASSQYGLAGIVAINQPLIDPERALITLPTEVLKAENSLGLGCSNGGKLSQGRFVSIGRGGIPLAPDERVRMDSGLADLGKPLPQTSPQLSPSSLKTPTPPIVTAPATEATSSESIVEAQGWFVNARGEIILTEHPANVEPHPSGLSPATCQTFSQSTPN